MSWCCEIAEAQAVAAGYNQQACWAHATTQRAQTMPAWEQDDVATCFDYYAGLAEKLDTRQVGV